MMMRMKKSQYSAPSVMAASNKSPRPISMLNMARWSETEAYATSNVRGNRRGGESKSPTQPKTTSGSVLIGNN